MARENFSIGALYNITKNQHNRIKTVGRDSFLSPKPLKYKFLGVSQPQGSHSPYILGDTTRPGHVTCVLVWSKSDRRRLKKNSAQTNKQTDKQTNRHYENNGHLAVNQQNWNTPSAFSTLIESVCVLEWHTVVYNGRWGSKLTEKVNSNATVDIESRVWIYFLTSLPDSAYVDVMHHWRRPEGVIGVVTITVSTVDHKIIAKQ